MKKQRLHMTILRHLALAGLAAILLASCTQRMLNTELTGTVTINYRWNAPSGTVAGDKPSSMKLFFFRDAKKTIEKESDAESFTGKLPVATYKVLSFNDPVRGVVISGDKFENMTASAPTEGNRSVTYIAQPDFLYSGNLRAITVKPEALTQKEMPLDTLVKIIRLNITVTGDFSAVESIKGTVSGIATGICLSNGQTQGNASVQWVCLNTDDARDKWTTTIRIFGINPESNPCLLGIDLGINHTEIALNLQDVTQGILNLNEHIDIPLDVDIDVKKNSQGEFTGSITDWRSEDASMDANN